MPHAPRNRVLGLLVVPARRRCRTDFGTAGRSARALDSPQVMPPSLHRTFSFAGRSTGSCTLPCAALRFALRPSVRGSGAGHRQRPSASSGNRGPTSRTRLAPCWHRPTKMPSAADRAGVRCQGRHLGAKPTLQRPVVRPCGPLTRMLMLVNAGGDSRSPMREDDIPGPARRIHESHGYPLCGCSHRQFGLLARLRWASVD